MDARSTLVAAGALLALGTVLGAFGAHALKGHLAVDQLQVYQTAVQYQFIHALGLLAIGILLRSMDSSLLRTAALLLLVGIVLFSGSLYLLTFGAPRLMGVVTPVGGLAMISGWVVFCIAMLR